MTPKTKAPAVLAQKFGKPLITTQTLRQIYTTLLECRMLAQHAGVWIERSITGLAAVAAVLRAEDMAAPASESLTTLYALGAPLEVLASTSVDKAAWKGILPPGPSSAHLLLATGAAAALQRKRPGNIVAAFVTGSRIHREALHYSGQNKLPILYVCHARRSSRELADLDFPVIPVDEDDAVAIYRVAFESIARARSGGGPTVIDCQPYPGRAEDAVLKMERYLTGRSLFREEWKQQVASRFAERLEAMERESHIASHGGSSPRRKKNKAGR